MEGKPSDPNLNGPNPGAANPNDTGFLPAVGGAPFGWKHCK
jgi:hypothetical protein